MKQTKQYIQLNTEQQYIFNDILTSIQSKSKDPFLFCIKGNAGSGKSTLSSFLIEELSKKSYRYNISLTAPTHQAVRVLDNMVKYLNQGSKGEDTADIEVSTIHSFLSLKLVNNYQTGIQELKQDLNSIIKYTDILFIDEASMVNKEMFDIILLAKARNQFKYLILIGDPYQLKPVSGGINPLFDEANISEITTERANEDYKEYKLEKVVRQAKGNDIIEVSNKAKNQIKNIVENKEYIPFNEFYGKFIYDYSKAKSTYIKLLPNKDWLEHLLFNEENKHFNYNNCLALAHKNVVVNTYNNLVRKEDLKELSQNYLNKGEVIRLNAPNLDKEGNILHTNNQEVTIQEASLKTTKTKAGNRLFFWKCFCDKDLEIRFIDIQSKDKYERLLREQANKAKYSKGKDRGTEWKKFFIMQETFIPFTYRYALTIHKSQGSSIKNVYLDIKEFANASYLSDEEKYRLFYVGISRAKEHLYVKV